MQAVHKKNTNQTHPLKSTSTTFYHQLQHHRPKLLTILFRLETEPQQTKMELSMVYTNVEVICIQLIVQNVLEDLLIK
jgi:hypothetical protein